MGNKTQLPRSQQSLEQGRIALEALHSREVAAQFHAAALELQLAMRHAELGDSDTLDRWLESHRELLGDSKSNSSASAGPHFLFDAASGVSELPVSEFYTQSTNNSLESIVEHESESHDNSPWLKMVEGARRRAAEFSSNASPNADATIETDRNHTESIDIPTTSLLELSCRAARIDSQHRVEYSTSESSLSAALDTFNVSACEDSLDESIIIPPSLQAAFDKPAEGHSKKSFRRWFLSPSILGSGIVHLLALVAMSVYVIRIANTTEPKSIIASDADVQEVSMEAPMELNTPDSEQLDFSEPQTPTLPSFATQATATSSSSIELPASMTGVSLGKAMESASQAAQQATGNTSANGASKSNMPNSVAEFFGVKAAGNTFCYLVDCSPSMKNDNAFAAAKAQLVRSITTLKPKQRFYVSFFGREIEDLTLEGQTPSPFPVYATPENLQKARSWIEGVRVQKFGKAPTDALKRAIDLDPDGIFLLFDGDSTVDIPAFLRKANRSNDIITGDQPLVPIHTLGFYDEDHQDIMKRIAQENLGTFRFIPNPNKK